MRGNGPAMVDLSEKSKYKKLLQVLILVAVAIVTFGTLILSVDSEQLMALGYGGIFITALLSAVSLSPVVPSGVVAFVAGGRLDPFLVSVVAGLGSAIGESTGYGVGYASRGFLSTEQRSGTWYVRAYDRVSRGRMYRWLNDKVFTWMRRYPFLTLFIIAAIPNWFVDVGGLIAGRTSYPFSKFFIAIALGKIVRFALIAYLGAWIITKL